MSVTVTSLGSNSRKIEISNESDINAASGIIDSISTALTDLGWTLFDTTVSGARNCFITKVYTADCNDGGSPSKKYMILRFDGPRRFWYVSCAESWNDTTHVTTNECFTQGRSFPLPLQLNNCVLYVWASARYAIFQGAVRGELGPWQGIVEYERVMSDDNSSGAPCFGYTNEFIIGSPYYVWNSLTTIDAEAYPKNHVFPIWPPRTPLGTTGMEAIRSHSIVIGNIPFPPNERLFLFNSNTGSLSSNTVQTSLGTGLASLNSETFRYNANTSLRPIADLRVTSQALGHYDFGRIYGLKLTTNLGAALDTITVPVDGNLFFSNTGSNNSHYILPISGGPGHAVQVGVSKIYQELIPAPATNSAIFDTSGLVKGRYIFNTVGTANNTQANVVSKLDLDNGTWSNIALPGTAECIIYDGGNNVYVTTGVGVSRINVDNNAIANLTSNLAGGASALTINDTYLMMAQKTQAATNVKIDIVNLSSFTVERQIISLIPAVQSVGGANATANFTILTTADYTNNNVFFTTGGWHVTTGTISTFSNFYLLSASNGAVVANTIQIVQTAGVGSWGGQVAATYYNDDKYLYYHSRGAGTVNTTNYGKSLIISLTNAASMSVNATSSSGNGNVVFPTAYWTGAALSHPYKYQEAASFKGYRITNGHRGSGGALPTVITSNFHHIPVLANNEFDTSINNGQSGINTGPAESLVFANTATASNTFFPFGPMFTDGCSLYRMYSEQNSGIFKGQANQTRNNAGVSTPVLLIPS